MLRVLILVADPALSAALLAALEGQGSIRAAVAGDPATNLESAEWDVCVADATFAEQAAAARRGRGLVVLRATRPMSVALEDRDRGTDVLLMRIPCSVATLQDAVQLAADTIDPRDAG